jgi:hypothetical protein
VAEYRHRFDQDDNRFAVLTDILGVKIIWGTWTSRS